MSTQEVDSLIAEELEIRSDLLLRVEMSDKRLFDLAWLQRATDPMWDTTSVQLLRGGDVICLSHNGTRMVDAKVEHVGWAGYNLTNGGKRYEIGTDQDGQSGDEWYPADLEVLVRLPRPEYDEMEPF